MKRVTSLRGTKRNAQFLPAERAERCMRLGSKTIQRDHDTLQSLDNERDVIIRATKLGRNLEE